MKENWEIHWKDYYQILQLHPSAESEVVKAAYDRLARKYHPDTNKDPTASARMKDLNEAFEIINSPIKRALYDKAYFRTNTSLNQPQTNAQPKPVYSKPYDDSWEGLFIPLPSDTILQKRHKVINAIEYIIKTQKIGYWTKLGLEVKLNKLKYPENNKPNRSFLTEDDDLYQKLSYIVEELDKEKAWRQLFTKSDIAGYFYVPNKRTGK